MKSVQTSLYCWIVLVLFIIGTMIFMINFYNRAVTEISQNSQLIVQNRLDFQISENYVKE